MTSVEIKGIEIAVSDPHPCWITIVQDEHRIVMTHRDLQIFIDGLNHIRKETALLLGNDVGEL